MATSLACRALAAVGFGGNAANRLSILIFHRVLPERDPVFPSEMYAQRFDSQLAQLKRHFRFMSLAEGIKGLREGKLPPRAACITFDDGYADNSEIALPILQKHGLTATFFVASGFLDGGRMWNDTVIELVRAATGPIDFRSLGYGRFEIDSPAARHAAIAALLDSLKYLPVAQRLAEVDKLRSLLPLALPEDLMMTSAQVRQLHQAGMEIGGHTVHHPILARMDADDARREIIDGKTALEKIIDAPVRLFAYPNGKPGRDYLAEHALMVKEAGFEAAVSTSWGAARPGGNLFQLPRFTPWDQGEFRYLLRLARNARRDGDTV